MKKAIAIAVMMSSVALSAAAADLASDANYKAKCAVCHGAAGEGKSVMKTAPLKDSAAKSEADLTAIITKGKEKMPAFDGKLAAGDIKTIVAEIKGLK